MLAKIWTTLCLSAAAVCTVAWIVALMHEHGIRPACTLAGFFRKQSKGGRIVLAAFFLGFWIYAANKPGDGSGSGGSSGDDAGGTNTEETVGMVLGDAGTNGTMFAAFGLPLNIAGLGCLSLVESGDMPVTLSMGEETAFGPVASTNVVRQLADEDFRRGFVLTRTGTGETFDFSAPSNATVCADWRAFGAADDWVYSAFTNGTFRLGTNDVDRFRVFSFGRADALVTNEAGRILTGNWLAPFRASLGIVPEANWNLLDCNAASNSAYRSPSQFWSSTTPSNTLRLTWQNVLLNRETNSPVSFQAELWPSGKFLYRYDLSRLHVDTVSNIVAGASFGGNSWTTNALATDVTSMVFHPLTAEDEADPDRDGDGVPTVDELFVYGTDPDNADTDFDGLSDSDELFVYNTSPLDPHSRSAALCDGFAVKIGDVDPFSYPGGSTNTVLEHVFYSGTTNGVFAYPQSSGSSALLRVSVSGAGSGELVVGSTVVPLLAPSSDAPAPASTEGGGGSFGTPLLVQVARGEDVRLYLRGDSTLSLALDSDDFAFGTLPSLSGGSVIGFVNFPNTVAETPCIHDFNARRKSISLPVASGAEALACTWSGSDDVEVENAPPRSAVVTGSFNARSTSGITYTLSHPCYLFGRTAYAQTVRFCPRPPDADPDDPDAEDPPWFAGGDGDDSGSNSTEREERWCCFWGTCCDGCGSCFCGCEDESCCGGGDAEEDDGDFDDDCPQHGVPYAQCAPLHAADYTNAVQNVEHLGGVLYIRDPLRYEQIDLVVPTERRNCCPCPDHDTNYVAVAYKSYRLNLVDAGGLPFSRTETSCAVRLAGCHPSSSVGDAELAFSRNGEIYRRYAKTVLGVGIESPDVDLPLLDSLAPAFGLPMTVCTNVTSAPALRLVTNVRLPAGNIHLELDGATGPFAVWYLDRRTWTYRRLLDSATAPVKDLSLAFWKKLMRRASDGDSSELPVYVTSSTPGGVRLVFRYWGVVDGRFVEDEAVQRIASIAPPLLPDYTRDGSIDTSDAARALGGEVFRYWTNEDCDKGDYVGQMSDTRSNVESDVSQANVKGRYDLPNLFPVRLDVRDLVRAFGSAVDIRLYSRGENLRYCLADLSPAHAGNVYRDEVQTTSGEDLHAAQLLAMPTEEQSLESFGITNPSAETSMFAFEAIGPVQPWTSPELVVRIGGRVVIRYGLDCGIDSVRAMYRWMNVRHLSNEDEARSTDDGVPSNNPDAARAPKKLFFLHGAAVSEANAGKWGDQIFKRLWLSGANVDFYNVDWRSDIGLTAANYQQNASNAFEVASSLAPILSAIPGDKVIMAHSLGNMVVSSMIQDHGLTVSKYLMCNSAVPAEAYDSSLSLRVPQLVHPDWEDYPTNTWASNWHTLFRSFASDDRRLLGWPGRFSNVAQYAVNFYSTGDEVLELYANNSILIGTGIWGGGILDFNFGHLSWHKQELFKGRASLTSGLGGTDWSGWGFDLVYIPTMTLPVSVPRYSSTQAAKLLESDLRQRPVFATYPSSMTNNVIPLLVRAAHLTQGIPALTPATGVSALSDVLGESNDFNLNLNSAHGGVAKHNEWPNRSDFGAHWLHSDMKDVAFYFNYEFFNLLIEKGSLK